MNTLFRIIGFMLLARAIRFVVLLVFAAMVLYMLTGIKANAAATSARHGVVVAMQVASVTPSQDNYGYQQPRYESYESSHSRAIVGGAIGGLVGAIVGRHSYQGRYLATAAGTAIGAAIGNNADHRAQEREQEVNSYQQARQEIGVQVIVKLDDGQTLAVFSNRPVGIYPGAKVWLIGNDELIADN